VHGSRATVVFPLPPSLPTYLRRGGQYLGTCDVLEAIHQDVGVGVAPGEGTVFLGRKGGRGVR